MIFLFARKSQKLSRNICTLQSTAVERINRLSADSKKLLREGFDKDQPGCSAEKFWDHNFFDLAESTTYGDQLGGGLWVGGSPGPPGQGGKVSGGHKGPFVANLQIASSRPIFIQMSSY